MVVVNVSAVQREMERQGITQAGLADRMGVHFNTVRNLLAGEPVNHSTQIALFDALGGRVKLTSLFRVTLDAQEATPR
jgi:transcriptional regulator with XRE-family HTH domain